MVAWNTVRIAAAASWERPENRRGGRDTDKGMKTITMLLAIVAFSAGCAHKTVYLCDAITGELHVVDAPPGETIKLRGRVYTVVSPSSDSLSTVGRLRKELLHVPLGDTEEVDEWVAWLSGVERDRHPEDPITISIDLKAYQRPVYDVKNTDPFADAIGHTNRPPRYATTFSMASTYGFLVELAEHAELKIHVEGRRVILKQE